MTARLEVSVGQHSDRGRKPANQDFHGAWIPGEPERATKGIAIALADGISTSEVSHIASETAVRSFLEDYFCTSEAWSVKNAAQRVLTATNSWLHAQTRRSRYREDADRGYVCTLSALVVKAATAHLFHVGDARIYRLRDGRAEQLTEDHRIQVGRHESYLGRALGVNERVEIDYQSLALEAGDVFVLVTDGVHEYLGPGAMADALRRHDTDLDDAARALVAEAREQGSGDNLTAQVVRIDAVPEPDADTLHQRLAGLPFPPPLEARMVVDGYEIVREVHASSRSHVYLARDTDTGAAVALKTPAADLREDPVLLERFLTEEWIARRLHSPHIIKPRPRTRAQSCLYVVTEFVEGASLRQWMVDNPRPGLEQVRGIVEQIARGLRAFHRQEMLHQDLRPENVLIDATGTVKLIDFGSASVAGITEGGPAVDRENLLGTAQYSAPECLIGEGASPQSDLYALGVITYRMLTGSLPYGAQVARCRTRAALNRLKYDSARNHDPAIPVWVDGALRKAVHPNPHRRYQALSEFVHDLRDPNREFLRTSPPPLVERNPERFWKGVSLALALTVMALLVLMSDAAGIIG